jgi:uncharacterized protein with PIN domain
MAALLCPQCRGREVHRSRRRHSLERLASAFGFLPYRCSDCSRRFWRFVAG